MSAAIIDPTKRRTPKAGKATAPDALSPEELRKMHAYWRAANYLSVGQIYLMDNPLLKEPLQRKHIKPRLLGHWGTTPGQNFLYVHLNRVIKEHDLNMLYISGPGHGGPALVANAYLEGTYSEFYPNVGQDEAGLKRLFTQFSFPGGIPSHVAPDKKAEVIRVYLPPDANTLLSVTDHCLRSRNYVNLVVASKQPAPLWLTIDQVIKHCTAGLGIWEWASNDRGGDPDVVMACCGDVPTLETLAAVELLRKHAPDMKVRVINVVDLMKLQTASEHPHGLSDQDFDNLFTRDKPIVFAFHGYPWLIDRLTYRRTNHKNLHVRGYKEEGTTTTPFDMVVLNDLDRCLLIMDVIDRLPQLGSRAASFKQMLREKLIEHKQYICKHGDDMPEIAGWRWGLGKQAGARATSTEGTMFSVSGRSRSGVTRCHPNCQALPRPARRHGVDGLAPAHGSNRRAFDRMWRGAGVSAGPATADVHFCPRFHQSPAACLEDVRTGRVRGRRESRSRLDRVGLRPF
jgi:phosphoketolase